MPQITRRRFLISGGATAAGLVLASCSRRAGLQGDRVSPGAPAVVAAEERRRRGAPARELSVVAAAAPLDLDGRVVQTWSYGDAVPGPEIRARAGEALRIRLSNKLPRPTSIHWHGIALRNDMDGVPPATQRQVAPGEEYTYEFTVPDPGTYFFHPHVGLQLDRGLYAPLIIEDRDEPGAYDREVIVVLDDWTDGVGESPDAILARLQKASKEGGGHEMGGMSQGMQMDPGGKAMKSDALGGDAGDVSYPVYLVNGRPPSSPATFEAKPGERVRFRIINAGSDTAFRVALGGHRLTVTHSDGFPVEPVEVDAVLLGMGERYDVTATLAAGAFPLVAAAEGKAMQARAVVRTGSGAAPGADVELAELKGRLLELGDLRAGSAVALPAVKPDRTYDLRLEVARDEYRWLINGKTFKDASPLRIRQGEAVRLVFENRTSMFHPMHVHGHTFQMAGLGKGPGARKDTVIVRPKERIAVDLLADNPGQWMIHCHNAYHQEAGMMTTLSYIA